MSAQDADERTAPTEGGPVRKSTISVVERVYFGIIAAAALFVTWLGWAAPERMDESFTWVVLPPLHARFVGALYFFGGVYMVGSVAARYRRQMTPAYTAIILFTGLLLAVTLLNLEAFDFDLGPPWVWTLSYVIYPLLGVGLIWWTRDRVDDEVGGPELPRWVTRLLLANAVVFAAGGVLLLVFREFMGDHWPWPISNGLAQFYGGPFIAIAYCCWRYSTRLRWRRSRTSSRPCSGSAPPPCGYRWSTGRCSRPTTS